VCDAGIIPDVEDTGTQESGDRDEFIVMYMDRVLTPPDKAVYVLLY